MAFVLVGTPVSLLIVLANSRVFGEMPSIDDFAKSNRIARQPGFMQKMEP